MGATFFENFATIVNFIARCSDHTDSVVRLMLDEVERKSCQLNQEVSTVLRRVKVRTSMTLLLCTCMINVIGL